MFLAAPLAPDLAAALLAYETPADALHAHGREIYWLAAGRTTDSLIDWTKLGKAIALPPVTVRNITTVRKLAAKYGA